ncbi:MAG: ABC transporter permease [Bacilli bacterium]
MSNEQKKYINNVKFKKFIIFMFQIMISVVFIISWEFLAREEIINSFISSSPSKIVYTIIDLFKNNNIFHHIWVTSYETIIAFCITSILSFFISILLYESEFLSRVVDPYLTMFNSLPKVALGPIIIIWIGANTKSIVTMAVLISIIVSIQTIFIGFKNTSQLKIKLLKTFKASKFQILLNAIIPENKKVIINSFKINISMCLIGVIMGEFLTSKAGIGYLILYGTQVFNLDLVMSGIILLLFLSIFMYKVISLLEKHLDK